VSAAARDNRLDIAVVRTGTANIASIIAGLCRAGAEPTVTDDPDVIGNAPAVVLPGVGSYSAAMKRLGERDLIAPLRKRIKDDRPTLAICLGMQLLFESSEESPNVEGLSVAAGVAMRFTDVPRVPHMGWNAVQPDAGCELLEPGDAYFANSYRIIHEPDGWAVARTTYGSSFICAIERGNVLACQFHPELSGNWGQALLNRWVERARKTTTTTNMKGGDSC